MEREEGKHLISRDRGKCVMFKRLNIAEWLEHSNQMGRVEITDIGGGSVHVWDFPIPNHILQRYSHIFFSGISFVKPKYFTR